MLIVELIIWQMQHVIPQRWKASKKIRKERNFRKNSEKKMNKWQVKTRIILEKEK